MNKNNAAVSTSASASSIDQIPKKRRRSKLRLPTPPPDPTLCTPSPSSEGENKSRKQHDDAEFLEYLDSLQKPQQLSRSTSTFAPALASEDAFDHLDKLYKLMGQMLTLREQNVLLHRRIKDLERLRSMQDMHKQFDHRNHDDKVQDIPEFDPDSFYAENVLYNILSESKKDLKRQKFPLLRKKGSIYDTDPADRRVSIAPSTLSDKQSKVSKWTKVKAAFKWEKASPSVSDAKSQDSGLGLIQPVNYEVARYLRVPSTSEEAGTSPADSGAAEISTPATLSSASSVEDVHRRAARRRVQEQDTSDDDQLFSYEYIPPSKDEPSTSKCNNKRTPWAKVKDIIQTRQSFKKRHRLSAKSDDFKSDDHFANSDDEEVFEEKPVLIVQSPEEISKENEALSLEHNIPVDVIAKYRIVDEETMTRQDSKWKKVKEVFLAQPPNADPNDEKINNEQLQEEIQKNYLKLHKKLSLEFQEKVHEWQRQKLSSPNTNLTVSVNAPHEDTKELAFKKKMEEWEKIRGQPKHNMQLQSEQNLPPEFRKKLQEWKKIKKCSVKESQPEKRKPSELPKWKSLGGTKTDLETKPLSQDFLKKYESWKQIKAGLSSAEDSADGKGVKTPSPKISRKDGESKRIKDQTDKEMQWFEKELGKIEREKVRVERERHKFLDREERLSKIRRSIGGTTKKEILVQTPSGFYRFEGISRKFTQKLYEWEKARGIRPEESTFALLKSSCIPNIGSKSEQTQGILTRSKSADSVMNVDINPCPLLSQQPSSLSLNELEKLEKDIILDESVIPTATPSNEIVDDHLEEHEEEPEALIVEVEDVVEETAAFVDNYMEQHYPIYQKQDDSKMCSGETNVAPKVRRSESVHAQANYNLIEEIIDMAKELMGNEDEINKMEEEVSEIDGNSDLGTLKNKQEVQKQLSDILIGKLIKLQEANSNIAMNATKEESKLKMTRLVDVLDTIQDLTSELFNLAEIIDNFIYKRNKMQLESTKIISSKHSYPQISENLHTVNKKILELRRNLSYICAASDMSVSNWKQKDESLKLRRMPSIERKRNVFRKSKSREDSEETLKKQIEQGAVKKRQRFRQKGPASKTLEESDDEDTNVMMDQRKSKPRRVRSQNSTESNKSKQEEVKPQQEENIEIVVDPELVEKILVPTKSTSFSLSFEDTINQNPQPQSSTDQSTVFVKTTKKVFNPIEISNPPNPINQSSNSQSIEDEKQDNVKRLPPLPSTLSPQLQRKIPKEISPNIRMMMVRYNQKLTEESGTVRSGGSSGSNSPVAWRSPVFERRVKAQTEKYQQEIQNKMSPLLGGRREVQKSASMGVMVSGNKQFTVHGGNPEDSSKIRNSKGILKSSSVGVLKNNEYYPVQPMKSSFKPILELEDTKKTSVSLSTLCDARNVKIQKAKEEFLNLPSTKSSVDKVETMKSSKSAILTKNRLSQISMGSESSCSSSNYGILMKSASAGMINIDPDTYKQFDPEVHVNGCVSLPRSAKKNLFSNITSKFRKVRMRRHHKEQNKSGADKMNTVSTLCRQSLVVDISNSSQETLSEEQQSRLSIPSDSRGSSTDTSPCPSRTSSWIKRPKLFNKHK